MKNEFRRPARGTRRLDLQGELHLPANRLAIVIERKKYDETERGRHATSNRDLAAKHRAAVTDNVRLDVERQNHRPLMDMRARVFLKSVENRLITPPVRDERARSKREQKKKPRN